MSNESDGSSEGSGWSSAEEIDDEPVAKTCCLFCDQTFESVQLTFKHLNENHRFDLLQVCKSLKFDSIKYIKLINFIRKSKLKSSEEVLEAIQNNLLDSDDLMKPIIEDDQLLMFDIEDATNFEEENLELSNKNSDCDLRNLTQNELIEKLKHSQELVKRLQQELYSLRKFANELLTKDNDVSIAGLSKGEDSFYVSSYSHFSIHHEMLNDKIRTEAYRDAILENSHCFEAKTVLDVGCGTGILSLFAAKAGARQVVAVDHSDVIYNAMDIVKENGFDHVIKCLKGKIEQLVVDSNNIPKQFDVIISEWMGYFLLFEGMLDTIIFARDNFLKKDGLILPNRCSMSIAGSSDQRLHDKYIGFWNNVYGYKMNCMKSQIVKEAAVEDVDFNFINTNVCVIKEIDMMKCTLKETQDFAYSFCFTCHDNQPIVAIVGWFDCYFDEQKIKNQFHLSTSPNAQGTHWKQVVFFFDEPIKIGKGNDLEGEITIERDKKDIRSLIVKLKLKNGQRYLYFLS